MVHFDGLSARQAKRRALNYWYTHRNALGLSMTEFFERCRLSDAGRTARITFYLQQAA